MAGGRTVLSLPQHLPHRCVKLLKIPKREMSHPEITLTSLFLLYRHVIVIVVLSRTSNDVAFHNTRYRIGNGPLKIVIPNCNIAMQIPVE